MNAIHTHQVYLRSMATRQSNLALSKHVKDAINIQKAAGFDLIMLESSGIGQSDTEIIDHSSLSLYVMTPEYGAASQLEKIDMLDFADIVALNKFDKRGGMDALRDVKKQFQRNRGLFHEDPETMPVFPTIASQFNDPGITQLYKAIIDKINTIFPETFISSLKSSEEIPEKIFIIPPQRNRYLSEISDTVRTYNQWVADQSNLALKLQGVHLTIEEMKHCGVESGDTALKNIENLEKNLRKQIDQENLKILESWKKKVHAYQQEYFSYVVREQTIKVKTFSETLSHLKVPKIAMPTYSGWGDILKWSLKENVPGEFPFTSGVFPFKREVEDPTRMFAGEGGPERTNKRFHYLSHNMRAKRLSTAFDSVTLYGNDPDIRPDIYGKVGNSGVSICCLDDAKKLYSGFRLTDPMTSVSMTINGPAPVLVGFFMNAAIDQNCELYIREHGLTEEVNQKIDQIYKGKGTIRPTYQGELPESNDGLGLMLLGVTGDQVLPREVYEKIKAETISFTERRSGAKHLHLFNRFLSETHGRCAGVFYQQQYPKLLLSLHLRLPYC